MATKEEYEKALKEMNDAFYGITFLNSQTRRFDDNLNLLRELVNEHFEEKQETNFEHFKNEIKDKQFDFAVIEGKVLPCKGSFCDECVFNDTKACNIAKIKWLYEQYNEKYNLTQFEYDLLSSHLCKCKFKNINALAMMKEKGYFEGIDGNAKIEDILENCEVIKND